MASRTSLDLTEQELQEIVRFLCAWEQPDNCEAEARWTAHWKCGCLVFYCDEHKETLAVVKEVACDEHPEVFNIAPATWERWS
jgi:hypothetical protein